MLTNGTLFTDPHVWQEIRDASLVLPSIDAATQDVMNRINRPDKIQLNTLDDLSNMLDLHVNEINKYLDTLEKKGSIQTVWQSRGLFYQLNDR